MADLSTIAQAPFSSTLTTSSSSLSASDDGTLGKEDFLKLLVTQLSNQDPMSPTDPTQFVSQLSQFSSLEQLMNVKSGLDLLAVTQTAGTSAQMVSFIGKTVSFSGNSVSWKQGDSAVTSQFELGGAAKSVEVTVRDSEGTAVRTISLGSVSKGEHAFSFDGLDDKGSPLATGTYSFDIVAKDKDGNSVAVNQRSQGVVAGVTFESGYPELVLADGRKLGLSQVIEVLAEAEAPPAVVNPVATTTTDATTSSAPTFNAPQLPTHTTTTGGHRRAADLFERQTGTSITTPKRRSTP